MDKELIEKGRLNILYYYLNEANPEFEKISNAEMMWEYPMTLVEEIENEIADNPDMIHDLISSEVSDKTSYVQYSGRRVYEYQTILARVYCLLYFLHQDDLFYKHLVYKPLLDNMGVYANDWHDLMIAKISRYLYNLKFYINHDAEACTRNTESKLEEQTKAHEEEVKKLMEKIETLEDANEKLLEKSGTYEAQINELKEQLENLQAIPVDNKNSEIPIDQKVRMEVVCRFYDLIKCAYLKPKKQTKAAELMAIITGLDHTTCNSYLSNRRNGKPVSKDFHQKEFDRIYQLYEELEIKAD